MFQAFLYLNIPNPLEKEGEETFMQKFNQEKETF